MDSKLITDNLRKDMNEQIIVLLAVLLLTGVSILGWHWFITRVVYHYSGVEFIWRKLIPAKQEQKHLPTLPLWLVGIYIAFFGLASQRYENRVDIIENKTNTIYPQLTSPDPKTKEMAFRRIENIQQMECIYKPNILNPASVCLSFFSKSKYEGVAELMNETIENWKGTLNDVDLNGFKFRNANLYGANLERAKLYEADLYGAKFYEANLKGADLRKANNLTINQLSYVATLYKAKLDPELMAQVKEKYPHLLEDPDPEENIYDVKEE